MSYTFRSRNGRDFSKLNSVPFQVQLLYTRPDGTRLLRVATATLSVTNDRDTAHKEHSVLLAAHAVRRSANLANAGQLGAADAEAKMAKEYLTKAAKEAKNQAAIRELEGQYCSLRAALDRAMARATRLNQLALTVDASDEDAVVFQTRVTTGRYW